MIHSAPMGVAIGCTAGYFNLEGDLDLVPPELRRFWRGRIFGMSIGLVLLRIGEPRAI